MNSQSVESAGKRNTSTFGLVDSKPSSILVDPPGGSQVAEALVRRTPMEEAKKTFIVKEYL